YHSASPTVRSAEEILSSGSEGEAPPTTQGFESARGPSESEASNTRPEDSAPATGGGGPEHDDSNSDGPDHGSDGASTEHISTDSDSSVLDDSEQGSSCGSSSGNGCSDGDSSGAYSSEEDSSDDFNAPSASRLTRSRRRAHDYTLRNASTSGSPALLTPSATTSPRRVTSSSPGVYLFKASGPGKPAL
ncbi:hypothetical protein LTR53_018147, partial [Teratosphaeriaceae sp. CCFEE 6253]